MTNKRILLLSFSFILILVLFGCNQPDINNATNDEPASEIITTEPYTSETEMDSTASSSAVMENPIETFEEDTTQSPVSEDNKEASDTNKKPCTITVGDKDYTTYIGDTVTYTFYLKTQKKIENVQASLTYDSTVLELNETTAVEMFPVLGTSCVYNCSLTDTIKFNASNLSGYDFTSEEVLISVSFKVLKSGYTSVNTAIEYMDEKGGDSYIDKYMIVGDITLREALST